jgi:hypothetical protein
LPFLPLLHGVIGGGLRSDVAFKPVCGSRELDVSRYGRQRWQRSGKIAARNGTVGGKSGNVWWDVGVDTPPRAVACGGDGRGLGEYAVVKVLARLGGRMIMELNYHRMGGMSRDGGKDCRVGKGIAAMVTCDTTLW